MGTSDIKKTSGEIRLRVRNNQQSSRDELASMSPSEIQEMAHELQVYQIELQTQNEELLQTHETLGRTRDRYYTLYNNAPVGYVTLDKNFVVSEVNRSALRILNVKRQAMMTWPLYSFVIRNEWDAFRRFLNDVSKKNDLQTTHVCFLRADNEAVALQIQAIAIESEETKDREILVTLSDFTEEHYFCEALQQSEQRYRFLYEQSYQANLVLSLSGCIIDVNSQAVKNLGYVKDEVVGQPLTNFVELSQRDAIKGVIDNLNAHKHQKPIELSVYAKDGTLRTFKSSPGNQIFYAEEGIASILFSATDITDYKQSVQKLKDQHTLLQTIFDSIPVMITLYDPSLNMLQLNKAVYTITGWTEADVQEQGIYALVYPDNDYCKKVREYMSSLEPGFKDLDMACKDGSTRKTSWANITLDDGRRVGIGLDISQRIAMEENLRQHAHDLVCANQELEAFTHSVSHDLKNPLNAICSIIAVLETLYNDTLDDDGKRCISEIKRSSNRMNCTINDLLRLSRTTKHKPVSQLVDITKIAAAIVKELRTQDPEKEIKVTIENNLTAHTDEGLLYNALSNLMSNAWKYSSSQPAPEITVGKKKEDGQFLFFVQDNGEGFSMDDAPKVFQPFTRLPQTSHYDGTGIGLSIVKRVFDKLGGNIWVHSTPGNGATFYFTLPDIKHPSCNDTV